MWACLKCRIFYHLYIASLLMSVWRNTFYLTEVMSQWFIRHQLKQKWIHLTSKQLQSSNFCRGSHWNCYQYLIYQSDTACVLINPEAAGLSPHFSKKAIWCTIPAKSSLSLAVLSSAKGGAEKKSNNHHGCVLVLINVWYHSTSTTTLQSDVYFSAEQSGLKGWAGSAVWRDFKHNLIKM